MKIHSTASGTCGIQLSNSTTGEGEDAGFQLAVLSTGDGYINNPQSKHIRFSTNNTERARLTSDGKFLMGNTGSLDMGFGPQVLAIRGGNSAGYDGTAAAIFGQLDNDAATCIFYNASSTNGTNMLDTRCARSNDSAYTFHIMRSNSASDTEFRWRGDGNAFADGSFSGGGGS